MANLTLFNSYAPPTATSILPSGYASVGAQPVPLAHLEGVPTVNPCILPDGAKLSDQDWYDYRGFDWGAAACGSAATLLFAVPGTVMLTRNKKSTESAESQIRDAEPPSRSVEQPHAHVDPSQEDPYQLTSAASTTQVSAQSYSERISNLLWGERTRDMATEPPKTRYDVKAPVIWQEDPNRLEYTAAFYGKRVPEHVPIVLPSQPSLYPNATKTGRSVSFGPDTVINQKQSSQHQGGDQSQLQKGQSQYQDDQSQHPEDQSECHDDQSQEREGGERESGQEDPRDRDDGWRDPRSWDHTVLLRNRLAVDAILKMPELRRHLASVRKSTRTDKGTRNGWLRRQSLRSLLSDKRGFRTPTSVRPVPDVQESYRTTPAWPERGQAQPTAPRQQCQPTALSPVRTNTAAQIMSPEAQQRIWRKIINSRADSRHEPFAPGLQTSQDHGWRPIATGHEAHLSQTQTQTHPTERLHPPEYLPSTTNLTSGQHTELAIPKGGNWRVAKKLQPTASTGPQYESNVAQSRSLQAPVQQSRQQHAEWQQPQRNGDGHSVAQTFAPSPSQRNQSRSSVPPAGSEQFWPAQDYLTETLTSSQLKTVQDPGFLDRAPLARPPESSRFGTSTDYTAPRDPSTAPPISWGDRSTAQSSLRSDQTWGRQSLIGSSLSASQTAGNTSMSPQQRPRIQRPLVKRPRTGTPNTLGSIAEERGSGDSATVSSHPPTVHQPRPTCTLDPVSAQVFTRPGDRSQYGLVSCRSATPAYSPISHLGKRPSSCSPLTRAF